MYRLQKAETEKAEGVRRLHQIGEILQDSSKVAAARDAQQKAKDAAAKAEATVRDMELKVQSLRAKIGRTEERLFSGKVTNPKELANLQEESQSLKRRLSKAEDELLAAMIRLDEAAEALAQAEGNLSRVQAEHQTLTGDLVAERNQLEARLPELEATIRSIRESLSSSDAETFDYTSRRKGGTPVALLERDSVCGVCGVTVPLAVAQRVRERKAITTCPSCERILCAER
jgi:predicted  nucleic acid-binding Zn-ribbon protein